MKWAARILAACVVLAAGMGSAQTSVKRLALIIGNADYNLDQRIDVSDAGEATSQRTGHLPDLANSLNDARDIRDALARLNFDVSNYRENATRVDMITMLDAFGRKVQAAGPEAIVFVYYSGHGMQIEGENFLLPAGARLEGADFSQMSASAMQAVLSGVATPMTLLRAQLRPRSGDGVNIIVLDACRNNPWDPARRGQGGRGRGLADQNWGLGQTLIAFSTEPGNTAYDGDPGDRNSPYTMALKADIATANVDLFNMFNGVSRAVEQRTRAWRDGAQRPWINSVTVPQVCLAGCGRANPRLPSLAAGQVRLDFSRGEAGAAPRHVVAAEPYLKAAPVSVTVSARAPQDSVIVFQNNLGAYGGRALKPTISENFLTQINTDNVPSSFTLRFDRPMKSVTFLIPALWAAGDSGVTFPEWTATALGAAGEEYEKSSDGIRASYDNAAEQRHTLSAPAGSNGIFAVRFDSYSRRFAAFETVLIEEIIVEPK